MPVVTLARRPVSAANIAANLLMHGAGAINIDASRIPRSEDYLEKCSSVEGLASNRFGSVYHSWDSVRVNSWSDLGSWPANLICLHHPTCHSQSDGWVCASCCPTRTLFEKSRYFKFCQTTDELIRYLQTLLAPPDVEIPIAPNPSWDPPEGTLGLVAPMEVGEETLRRWYTLLNPGAHLAVLTEDGIDAGCSLEAAGFEIRDAIWIADSAETIYDVPKASRRERDAGVPRIHEKHKTVRYFPTEEIITECPKEGFALEDVPPDLAEFFEPREVLLLRRHSNYHSTVKPVSLMKRLMRGLRIGDLVLDPFLGSGTTAIAALTLRISCIGIEQDTEEGYLRIAHARAEYWAPPHAVIRCDVVFPVQEDDLWL